MDLSVPIILGTAREGRRSENAAEFVRDYLQQVEGLTVDLVDVRDYLFGQTYEAWNEHSEVPDIAIWKETAEQADGYIIVTPEYNHGPPGELKILLDAAFEEYFDKPVGLVGVSAGGFGGARVVEVMKPILIELGMTPLGNSVHFSNMPDLFDEDGGISSDDRKGLEDQIDNMTDQLKNYGLALRRVRQNKEE